MGVDRAVHATSKIDRPRVAVRVLRQEAAPVALNTKLELGSASFVCAWLGIFALHCVCAVYLTQLARVLKFMAHPYFEYFARLAMGDRHVYLHHASVVVGLVAALHYWQLLHIFVATLRARRFALPSSRSSRASSVNTKLTKLTGTASATGASQSNGSSFWRALMLAPHTLARGWQFLFSSRGMFGVESPSFHVVFTLREVVEIVSQTFQAHRSNTLLSSRALNDLLIALVVANCWSTPMLQHALRRHEGHARVACLLLDAVLTMGSSMGVPLAVFWPYYQALDPATFMFPIESTYDELWFSRLTMESRQLFSLATADVVSKLVPHVAIFSSLTSVVTLISRRSVQARATASVSVSAPTDASSNSSSSSKSSIEAVGLNATRRKRYRQAAVHLCFIAWGLALLALHVRAGMHMRDNNLLGCRQAAGAWFPTASYPCTVYTYNCYREGTHTPNDSAWLQLDTDTLMFLTIAHCSALVMPRSLQHFANLLGLHLHNVTLNEWSRAHALSATHHTNMVVLIVTRANMTHVPAGMLEPLPPFLMDIQFSHTNLTSVPTDIAERWHTLRTIYFEHSQLSAFPEPLLAIRAAELSLHSNRIEHMPEIPADAYFYTFVLSSNPITKLPDRIGADAMLSFVSFEDTLLETLPAWAYTNIDDTVFMHGTPYCAAQTPAMLADAVRVECRKYDDQAGGILPIAVTDRNCPL